MGALDPARLARLLRPEHIAAIGGRYANEVINQCRRIGFAGELWPVHPTRESMHGLRCHSSVAELPHAPDAAFVGVPREATVDTVAALAQIGCGGVVALASGFAEFDETGRRLQQELVAAAGDMPLVGPNCYGMLNYVDGAALWPDQHGGERCERGAAFVSQSGNIGVSVTMQQRSLPLAYVVSVGNQAVLTVADYVAAFAADERVSVIGLFLEGLNDIERFAAACDLARQAGKPIAVLKSGRSQKAATVALSHTSALAGADSLYDALFERCGAVRVDSQSQLLETLKLLHVHGPLPGRRIVSMSCSGGEAGLVADLADGLALELPAFPQPQAQALSEALGERVTIGNPLDYHTYIWADEQAMTACYSAALAAPVDAALLISDYPVGRCDDTDWLAAERAFMQAHRTSGNRAIAVSSFAESFPRAARERLLAAGIAPMMGLDECLRAIADAATVYERWQRPVPPALARSQQPVSARVDTLDEYAAKQLLAGAGVPIPAGKRVTSADAVAAAQAIGYPVVVKALGAELAHKTEVGGLRLGIANDSDLLLAVAELGRLTGEFLVECMVDEVVAELLVGVTRDPQFGLALTVGSGGVLVEAIADSASVLLPATRDDALRALQRLRAWELLQGFRGKPPGDIEAVVDAIVRIGEFACARAAALIELDVNPLLVRARGSGAVAADALLRLAAKP